MSFKYFNNKQSRLGLVLGATLLASPVAAQSICGGMGDVGAWIGGIEAASDLATSAGPYDTSGFIPANSEMISLFNLSAAADIRVEALPGDGGDTVIDLIDGNGNLLLSDDDGGGGGSFDQRSRHEFSSLGIGGIRTNRLKRFIKPFVEPCAPVTNRCEDSAKRIAKPRKSGKNIYEKDSPNPLTGDE